MILSSEDIISCKKCGAPLAPTAEKCSVCGATLTPLLGPTILENTDSENTIEPNIAKPDSEELPPYIRKIDIGFGLIILLIGIIGNFYTFKVNHDEVINEWVNEAVDGLYQRNEIYNDRQNGLTFLGRWINRFRNRDDSGWRQETQWPPDHPLKIVATMYPTDQFYNHERHLIERSNIVTVGDIITLNSEDFLEVFRQLRQANSGAHWLHILGINNWHTIYLEVSYWSPELPGVEAFRFRRELALEALYGRPIIQLLVLIFALRWIRVLAIDSYRTQRRKEYDNYQQRRTEKIFRAKAQLEKARRLAEAGEIAKALAITNESLKIVPNYKEAHQLKRLLLLTEEAGKPSLTFSSQRLFQTTSTTDAPLLLYLRIFGTPYAYLAPSGAESITIGRQRQKIGDSGDIGNDIVVRVPGSDSKSLRVSRRHLEIRRIDYDYFVIDKSNGQTKYNGKVMVSDQPVRLHSGDRLLIAGVLTLEVLIRLKISGNKASNVLQVNSTDNHEHGLLIEATVGDMVTEIIDE